MHLFLCLLPGGQDHSDGGPAPSYYSPQEIYEEVKEKVDSTRKHGLAIDYLTFVPDGEPTLDANLGKEIDMLKPLGIKIAVISNASLIWDEGVREDLKKADWVSLKLDAFEEWIWRRMDRPHRALEHDSILQGINRLFQGFQRRSCHREHAAGRYKRR
jgi:wyosine [tRNA(Phe)-imidazoG37] synthetase (radical SAM superfamily)